MGKRNVFLETLDLSNIERASSEQYQRLYGLNFNPFPLAPVSWEEEFFPPIGEEQRTELEEFIVNAFSNKEFSALAIIGDYGSGKSHLLKYLQSQINSQLGGAGFDRAVAILLINPPATTLNIVYEIYRNIGRSRITKLLWHVFFQSALALDDRVGISNKHIEEVKLQIQQKYFDVAYSLNHREFLEDFLQTCPNLVKELRTYVENVLLTFFPNNEYTQELASVMFSENEYESLQSWLIITGDDLNRSMRLERRFPAENQFTSLLRFLYKVGYSHTYLLIDEFSDINPPTRKQTLSREYLIDLGGLIKSNIEFFSLVIALPEQAWMQLKQQLPSFTQRFTDVIRLLPLGDEEATYLVQRYLSRARPEGKRTLKPFSEDVIREINDIAGGNVRAFLNFCFVSLEIAVKEQIRTITPKFIIQTWKGGESE